MAVRVFDDAGDAGGAEWFRLAAGIVAAFEGRRVVHQAFGDLLLIGLEDEAQERCPQFFSEFREGAEVDIPPGAGKDLAEERHVDDVVVAILEIVGLQEIAASRLLRVEAIIEPAAGDRGAGGIPGDIVEKVGRETGSAMAARVDELEYPFVSRIVELAGRVAPRLAWVGAVDLRQRQGGDLEVLDDEEMLVERGPLGRRIPGRVRHRVIPRAAEFRAEVARAAALAVHRR